MSDKPLTEAETVAAIDAHLQEQMRVVLKLEKTDVRGGAFAALIAMRMSLRNGDWRPKKTNVVSISARKR